MADEERGRGVHPSDPAEGSRQAGERAEAKMARRDQDEDSDDSGARSREPGTTGPGD